MATDLSNNTVPNPLSSNDIMKAIFNKSNIILLLWFLAIYLIVYFLIELFYKSDTGVSENPQIRMGRILDMMVFGFLFLYIVTTLSLFIIYIFPVP